MFARVNRLTGEAGRDDLNREFSKEARSRLSQIDGFRGLLSLYDGDSGGSIGITFWTDRAAMEASRSAVAPIREEGAARSGGSIVDVAEYEVALHDVEA